MEFKFRSVHDISPASFSPLSGVGNSSDQQFRGGYRSAEPQGNAAPRDNGEAIQRELEKEKIREELIAAQISRRRVLEAEVRMELMMERDMVKRRAAESSMSYEERVAMRFDPRYLFMPHPFEDHRWAFPARGPFNALPPPLQLVPEATVHQPKPEHRKDKIIFLAKPDPSLSGAKHKAKTPPAVGASELSPTVSKKKPKEEWSCALCQVRATSEKGLNEHLEGKKHKAKDNGLRARRKAKSSIGKKAEKSNPTEDTGSSNSEPGTKLDKVETNDKDLAQKLKDPEEDKNDKTLFQKRRHLKRKDGVGMEQNGEATLNIKKTRKFRFWCEICKIGAHSEVVMETHKKGKKHAARLKESVLSEAVPSSTATPETTSQEGKDADTAEEANEKAAENVTGDADIDTAEEANEKAAENVMGDADTADEANVENVMGDGDTADEANEKAAENVMGDGDTADEANEKAAENVMGGADTAEEANEKAAENVTGDADTAEEANEKAGENVTGDANTPGVPPV